MRVLFTLVSLLATGVIAAMYFTQAEPALQDQQYSKIQAKAQKAVQQMQHNPQDDVDAANGVAPATNAPASGN